MCGGHICIIAFIAFIAFGADIARILDHIGVDTEAGHCANTRATPCITLARGPPLWDDCGAQQAGQGVDAEPDWELANQSPPDCPDDQRTTW